MNSGMKGIFAKSASVPHNAAAFTAPRPALPRRAPPRRAMPHRAPPRSAASPPTYFE